MWDTWVGAEVGVKVARALRSARFGSRLSGTLVTCPAHLRSLPKVALALEILLLISVSLFTYL